MKYNICRLTWLSRAPCQSRIIRLAERKVERRTTFTWLVSHPVRDATVARKTSTRLLHQADLLHILCWRLDGRGHCTRRRPDRVFLCRGPAARHAIRDKAVSKTGTSVFPFATRPRSLFTIRQILRRAGNWQHVPRPALSSLAFSFFSFFSRKSSNSSAFDSLCTLASSRD